MKKILMISLLAILPGTGYAQSSRMSVQIPFEFRAGNKVLPAGEYRVAVDPAFNRMELRLEDGSAGLYLSAHPTQVRTPVDRGILVFNKYGDSYFLKKVFNRGRSLGYQLPPSKAEREMARIAASAEVASIELPSM